MGYYPNEVFSAFSFLGFVLSFIPLYWHLEGTSNFRCMIRAWDLRALPCSLEHRDLHVHDMDRSWLFNVLR